MNRKIFWVNWKVTKNRGRNSKKINNMKKFYCDRVIRNLLGLSNLSYCKVWAVMLRMRSEYNLWNNNKILLGKIKRIMLIIVAVNWIDLD